MSITFLLDYIFAGFIMKVKKNKHKDGKLRTGMSKSPKTLKNKLGVNIGHGKETDIPIFHMLQL